MVSKSYFPKKVQDLIWEHRQRCLSGLSCTAPFDDWHIMYTQSSLPLEKDTCFKRFAAGFILAVQRYEPPLQLICISSLSQSCAEGWVNFKFVFWIHFSMMSQGPQSKCPKRQSGFERHCFGGRTIFAQTFEYSLKTQVCSSRLIVVLTSVQRRGWTKLSFVGAFPKLRVSPQQNAANAWYMRHTWDTRFFKRSCCLSSWLVCGCCNAFSSAFKAFLRPLPTSFSCGSFAWLISFTRVANGAKALSVLVLGSPSASCKVL